MVGLRSVYHLFRDHHMLGPLPLHAQVKAYGSNRGVEAGTLKPASRLTSIPTTQSQPGPRIVTN